MYLIGIDIGGTNIKAGLVSNNSLLFFETYKTNAFDIVGQLMNIISEILESHSITLADIDGVSVGCPGVVGDGVVKQSVNLGLTDFDLQGILSEKLLVPVVVGNDADLATIAEYKLGSGVGCKNMVLLTIGTGVGGGIIVNGELYAGNGGAGELGHITYVRDGEPCNCGRKGCIEQYTSCTALSNRTKEVLENYPNSIIEKRDEILVSDLWTAYENGDICANIVINQFVDDVTNLVLNYCNIFRPELIVIGGGLTYAPKIIDMVAKKCKDQHYGYVGTPEVKILPSKLGNKAGVMSCSVFFNN